MHISIFFFHKNVSLNHILKQHHKLYTNYYLHRKLEKDQGIEYKQLNQNMDVFSYNLIIINYFLLPLN